MSDQKPKPQLASIFLRNPKKKEDDALAPKAKKIEARKSERDDADAYTPKARKNVESVPAVKQRKTKESSVLSKPTLKDEQKEAARIAREIIGERAATTTRTIAQVLGGTRSSTQPTVQGEGGVGPDAVIYTEAVKADDMRIAPLPTTTHVRQWDGREVDLLSACVGVGISVDSFMDGQLRLRECPSQLISDDAPGALAKAMFGKKMPIRERNLPVALPTGENYGVVVYRMDGIVCPPPSASLSWIPADQLRRCQALSMQGPGVTWADRYKPRSGDDVLGNNETVRCISRWLASWKAQISPPPYSDEASKPKANNKRRGNAGRGKKGKRRRVISSSDGDGENSDDAFCSSGSDFESIGVVSGRDDDTTTALPPLLLTGPPGSGKTAAVYACANELGFAVFELNCSTRRTGKCLLDLLGEATQSHQVVARGKNLFGGATVAGSGSASGSPASAAGVGTPKGDEFLRDALSLILLDEIDAVFDDDRGFWAAVSTLAQQSKRPVILSGSVECEDIALAGHVQRLRFNRPPVDVLAGYAGAVCAAEGALICRSDAVSVAASTNCDTRRMLGELQFWVGGDIAIAKEAVTPGTPGDSDPSMFPPLSFRMDAGVSDAFRVTSLALAPRLSHPSSSSLEMKSEKDTPESASQTKNNESSSSEMETLSDFPSVAEVEAVLGNASSWGLDLAARMHIAALRNVAAVVPRFELPAQTACVEMTTTAAPTTEVCDARASEHSCDGVVVDVGEEKISDGLLVDVDEEKMQDAQDDGVASQSERGSQLPSDALDAQCMPSLTISADSIDVVMLDSDSGIVCETASGDESKNGNACEKESEKESEKERVDVTMDEDGSQHAETDTSLTRDIHSPECSPFSLGNQQRDGCEEQRGVGHVVDAHAHVMDANATTTMAFTANAAVIDGGSAGHMVCEMSDTADASVPRQCETGDAMGDHDGSRDMCVSVSVASGAAGIAEEAEGGCDAQQSVCALDRGMSTATPDDSAVTAQTTDINIQEDVLGYAGGGCGGHAASIAPPSDAVDIISAERARRLVIDATLLAERKSRVQKHARMMHSGRSELERRACDDGIASLLDFTEAASFVDAHIKPMRTRLAGLDGGVEDGAEGGGCAWAWKVDHSMYKTACDAMCLRSVGDACRAIDTTLPSDKSKPLHVTVPEWTTRRTPDAFRDEMMPCITRITSPIHYINSSALFADYAPALRSICHTESLRRTVRNASTRTSRRFRHYLLNFDVVESDVDTLSRQAFQSG
eukprot:Opistho-2@26608